MSFVKFVFCVVWCGQEGGVGGSRETLFYPHSNPQQHQIEGGSIILRKRKEEKKEKRWKKEKGKKRKIGFYLLSLSSNSKKKVSSGNTKERTKKQLCVLCVIYVICIFPHN